MKFARLVVLLFSILCCCSSKRNQETTSSDSTLQVVDSSNVHLVEADQGVGINNSFPAYDLILLSQDPQEAAVTKAIQPIIDQFEAKNYHMINMDYAFEFKHPGEYEEVTEKRSESSLWMFDDHYNLKVYWDITISDGDDGKETENTLYLFSGDSLIVVVTHKINDGQIGIDYEYRMAASLCPSCGTSVTKEAGSSLATVKKLGQADLDSRGQMCLEDLKMLRHTLVSSTDPEKKDQKVIVPSEFSPKQGANVQYNIEYTMGSGVYEGWVINGM